MPITEQQFRKLLKLKEAMNMDITDVLDEVAESVGERTETFLYWYIMILTNPNKKVPYDTLAFVEDESDVPHGHYIRDAQYP